MKDPYQVLGISRDADDEQIKRAYRSLARRYHPDNYHDSALEDMAQEKMKEINAAYERLRRERGMRPAPGGGNVPPPGQTDRRPPPRSGEGMLFRARQAIFVGQLTLAESILAACPERTAEWYFLRGAIAFRRGWMDEATQNYQTACRMDPANPEYRQAMDYMENGPARAYSPGGAFETALVRCGWRLGRCGLCAGGSLCCCFYDAMFRTYAGSSIAGFLRRVFSGLFGRFF